MKPARRHSYHLARTLALCASAAVLVLGIGLMVVGAVLHILAAFPLGFVFACLGGLALSCAFEA